MKHTSDLDELITPMLLGDLDELTAEKVRQHASSKPDGATQEADLNATLSLLTESLAESPLPVPTAKPSPVRLIPSSRRRQNRNNNLLPLRLLAQAAVIAVFLGGAWVLISNYTPSSNQPSIQFPVGAAASAPEVDEPPAKLDDVQDREKGPLRLRLLDGFVTSTGPTDSFATRGEEVLSLRNGIASGLPTLHDPVEQILGVHRILLERLPVAADAEVKTFRALIVPANAEYAARPDVYPIHLALSSTRDDAGLSLALIAASVRIPSATPELPGIQPIDRSIADDIVARGNAARIVRQGADVTIKGKDGFNYLVPDVTDEDLARWQ